MKKTIITFITIMIIVLLGGYGTVQAASSSMSATNTNPTVGANVTITVRFSQPLATADFSLTYDSSKLQYVSNTIGGTNTGSSVVVGYIDYPSLTTKSSASFTFKTKAAGVANCSIAWSSASDAKGNEFTPTGSSISINVKSATSSKPSDSGNSSTTKPSNDKKPNFTNVNQKVNAKETVSIRDTWSTSGKRLGTLQKDASITRTGVGSNGWDRVTYNGKTAYISHTYLTTTKPKEDKKDDDDKKNNTKNEVSNNTTNEVKNNTVNNETTNNVNNELNNNSQANEIMNQETNEATNTQSQDNTKPEKKINTIEIIIIAVIVFAIVVIIINEVLAKKMEDKKREVKKKDAKRMKGSGR